MSAPRIGLTGFYGHGNFGDDMMAVLFGLALREAGMPFCVYRLCRPYAERYGFEVVTSPAELLESADVLVWGGGGLLVSWPDLMYRVLFRGAARDFTKIVKGALDRGIDLLACSVGGDGSCPSTLTPNFKELFVRASKFITVRNPEDLQILRRTGTPGAYYPDIMWLACDRFPATGRRRKGFRIGIDLYPSNLVRQRAWRCSDSSRNRPRAPRLRVRLPRYDKPQPKELQRPGQAGTGSQRPVASVLRAEYGPRVPGVTGPARLVAPAHSNGCHTVRSSVSVPVRREKDQTHAGHHWAGKAALRA